jgi:hypothetical protein
MDAGAPCESGPRVLPAACCMAPGSNASVAPLALEPWHHSDSARAYVLGSHFATRGGGGAGGPRAAVKREGARGRSGGGVGVVARRRPRDGITGGSARPAVGLAAAPRD